MRMDSSLQQQQQQQRQKKEQQRDRRSWPNTKIINQIMWKERNKCNAYKSEHTHNNHSSMKRIRTTLYIIYIYLKYEDKKNPK